MSGKMINVSYNKELELHIYELAVFIGMIVFRSMLTCYECAEKARECDHKFEDAFILVELCDLKFVYPVDADLFGKVIRTMDVLARGHKSWIDDFVVESAKLGFNMTRYLGVDAIEAAMWYDSLTAA